MESVHRVQQSNESNSTRGEFMISLSQNYTFWKASDATEGEVIEGIFTGIRTNQFKQKEIIVSQDESNATTLPINKTICDGLAIDPETFNLLPVPQLKNETTLGCGVKITYHGKKLMKKAKEKKPNGPYLPTDWFNNFSIGITSLPGGQNLDGVSQPTGKGDNTEHSSQPPFTTSVQEDDDILL